MLNGCDAVSGGIYIYEKEKRRYKDYILLYIFFLFYIRKYNYVLLYFLYYLLFLFSKSYILN